MLQEAIETSEITLRRERSHPRFFVDARVGLVREGAPDPMICRVKNLSWDGASLLVPGLGVDVHDPVALRFPWGRGGSFSAHAGVVWNQQVNAALCLVGVVFTKLRVRDEKKLKQLFTMLSRAQQASTGDASIADDLELCFLDPGEMLAALEQVRSGCMETTVFEPIQANERVPLVLKGLGDLPTLHLRGRILWQKALGSETNPKGSGTFRVAVDFDHPYDDLKQVTTALIARLNANNDVASVAGARSTRTKTYRKGSRERMSAAAS